MTTLPRHYCYCEDCRFHLYENRFSSTPENEAFGIGWEELATDPENRQFVSESDLPTGTYDDDMLDIGIALDRYIRGFDF